jgi:DNA-binding MarR family transcriptional regulator
MPRAPDPEHRTRPESPGCTCGRLRRLTRRVTAVYDRALAPCGLRITQFSLMSNLCRLKAPTLAQLAETMDMERTTLLRNLRPLVAAGWVRAGQHANTRQREVSLTPAGRAKWSAAKPLWRVAQNAVNSALGDSEVARLHRRVDHYLSRLPSPNSGD